MLKLLLRTCSTSLRLRRELDIFNVPAATFRTLYVVLILSLDLRRIIHLNVTASPTATAEARSVARRPQTRSKRSRVMTLFQAATKSRTNFSFASSCA